MGGVRTLLVVALLAVAGCSNVIVYSFSGDENGETPFGGVIEDAAGNIYGTTYQGGNSGNGTVFRLTPMLAGLRVAFSLTVLHSFSYGIDPSADGANPYGGLVADGAGNLYGTTYQGGGNPGGGPLPGCDIALGCGTVFRVSPSGVEVVLHRFTSDEGAHPYAGLIEDAAGNLYGTTYDGGATTSCDIPYGCGTVFQLTPSGDLNVLHRFTGSDGRHPYAGLRADAAGNLYGTTTLGGANDTGTVFWLMRSEMILFVLHSFSSDRSEGVKPYAGLLADAAGNLYGTTSEGGAGDAGTVFQLAPLIKPRPKVNEAKSVVVPSWTLTVLHSFSRDGSEGVVPYAGLIAGPQGDFIGTTTKGGANGNGTVYDLTPSGTLTVIHSFSFTSDGSDPSGVIADPSGVLLGTTPYGGANSSCLNGSGCGTIFGLP